MQPITLDFIRQDLNILPHEDNDPELGYDENFYSQQYLDFYNLCVYVSQGAGYRTTVQYKSLYGGEYAEFIIISDHSKYVLQIPHTITYADKSQKVCQYFHIIYDMLKPIKL